MTITLDLAPELEHKLRRAAESAGMAVDSFIIRSVEERLDKKPQVTNNGQRLSQPESDLLLKINALLADFPWERYHELVAKRERELLTADELAEIIGLSDQLEAANAQRMTLLVELARLRDTSLPALMAELGLRPRSHE
jgi:hypothetical protein